jgi:hypothetical protein
VPEGRRLIRRWAPFVALLACDHPTPEAAPPPQPPKDTTATPRCIRAGGKCVGPATIARNPAAPCPAGMRRVDDVVIDGGPRETAPACFGIPLGEEACCMP